MQIINLYKYTREDGGITVSPIRPKVEYTDMYRLVADEGKVLTNGEKTAQCKDILPQEYYDWQEVDDTEAYKESQ